MPLSIGGVVIPWWVYAIVIVIIIIVLYAFYKNLTAYTPQATAFNTTEAALPAGFDANGEAQYASSVFNETFGSDDGALVARLSALSDNELIAVSNAYNSQFYSNNSASLLTMLLGLDFPFTSSKPRDDLAARMQNLQIQ